MKIFIKVLISFLIWIFICVPVILISPFIVGVLLLTKWDGRSTIFGNRRHGRGNNHFSFPTKGYFQEFNWLVLRNPVSNLCFETLAVKQKSYDIECFPRCDIGDKNYPGYYIAQMGLFWEFHYIKTYNIFGFRKCVRLRAGWRIKDNDKELSSFTFQFNPIKTYRGV